MIEAGAIGYLIRMGNPFSYEAGQEVQVFTYLHVREDALELYGFHTQPERDMFLKLLSVKGIGPKTAMAIIASGAIDKVISAIENGDSRYLQKFPGIGVKASQQIILDLHGKLDFHPEAKENPKINDVRDALKSMGYNPAEIKAIIPVIETNLDKPVNELIKIVLKHLV